MTRSQILTSVALVLLVGSAALGQTSNRPRTFTGTYTCIACDLHKTIGTRAQCDTYGHDFGIKLTNGTYIHLLPNDHSVELVKGGGRTDFPISVTGIYDRSAHTIDVQRYSIDGIETAWCQEHGRMEMLVAHKQLPKKEGLDHPLSSR